MKSLKKTFSSVKTKANPNFAVKLAERSNRSFCCLLMNQIFQSSVPLYVCIELNWLCKHLENIRSSQPAIPFTELSETQLCPVSIVRKIIIFEWKIVMKHKANCNHMGKKWVKRNSNFTFSSDCNEMQTHSYLVCKWIITQNTYVAWQIYSLNSQSFM